MKKERKKKERKKKEIPEFNFDVVYEDYQYLYKQQGKKPFRTLQLQFLVVWIWNGENDKAQQVMGLTKEAWFLHLRQLRIKT